MAPPRRLPPRKLLVDDTALDDGAAHDRELDAYSSDEFRIYDFKVRRCMRGRSHDWTDCPFAHPGEKARRRDPRRFHYSGTVCPDFRRDGSCPRGEACGLAHGVFECWLHPARYRTMPCKDGRQCRRKVCFFAHTPAQLRVLPVSPPKLRALWPASPTSTLLELPRFSPQRSPSASPPISPSVSWYASDERDALKVLDDLFSALERMVVAERAAEKDWSCGPDLDWVEELLM
ncbi:hypothetical protein J5N97_027333 [Dioscorea zingiberensis]|uniref:C3H1-type domain-containing protein n=1 Tax=Dioscorea zingiberensis TaxID=325984 RepID=A0A9D5H7L2_9LILI|nr:hypothetical protein J5N97_027333 [Dioscorea zingiberensis]